MYFMGKLTTLFLTLSCTAGCASIFHRSIDIADTASRTDVVERRCSPPSIQPVGKLIPGPIPSPLQGAVSEDALEPAPAGFSRQAVDIAKMIGVLPLLRRLTELQADIAVNKEGTALRLMQVRQVLSDRLTLASFDVSTAVGEAHCEEERANQLADRLKEIRDKRVVHDTILAIVGGSTVGIVAGALDLAVGPAAGAIASIIGGSLEATFGSKSLFENVRYEYRHGVELLQEVWTGPERSVRFPTSVWRYLNSPSSDHPESTVREALVARWHRDGWLGEPGSETEQQRSRLFFGNGGSYEIEDLRAQAAMLDLLESDIMLMAHELHMLLREVLSRDVVPYAASLEPFHSQLH